MPQPHVIQELIAEFLKHLHVTVESIEEMRDAAHPIYLIKTPDSASLIGRGGENLQALNYLLRKLAEKRFGGEEGESAQFMVDVNGYQMKRIEELRQKAQMLAERARLFKHDVEMTPMSAYERMIIHATFSGSPDIGTVSEGQGKFRRIILKWKGDAPKNPETV